MSAQGTYFCTRGGWVWGSRAATHRSSSPTAQPPGIPGAHTTCTGTQVGHAGITAKGGA